MHAAAPLHQPSPSSERLLADLLAAQLTELPEATRSALAQQLQWLSLGAGQTLMRQGEPGDAMFWLVNGRLQAFVDSDGEERLVREMGRGAVIGEISLFTHEARSASVIAVRDSLLVRLDRAVFDALLPQHPALSVLLARQIVERLRSESRALAWSAPSTLALLPTAPGLDAEAFATALSCSLSTFGRVKTVMATEQAATQLATWEAECDFLLLVVRDGDGDDWASWCRHHADEWLLLADGDTEPPAAAAPLSKAAVRAEAARTLLLMHQPALRCPQGTADWLARFPVEQHLHLRRGAESDLQRLARLLARRGVGLVLAGGGAKGFAHLGVLRALQEAGVPIDCVGGTSMGAVMASLVASQRPQSELMPLVRSAFKRNPTGDFNLLPLVSLIRGRRMRQALRESVLGLFGHAARIEDLWLSCYVVATNYSRASEVVLRHGDLQTAVAASAAIPGALPPVLIAGELFCDGGSFNNFPLDQMRRQRGIGTVIGVDLFTHRLRTLSFDEVPGPWQLLRDRLRPRKQRRYKLPSLIAYLLNNTILYSHARKARDAGLADVLLQPPLDRVGLLHWARLDGIVQQGYDYTRQRLAEPVLREQLADLLPPASP
jgi:NTE family protein